MGIANENENPIETHVNKNNLYKVVIFIVVIIIIIIISSIHLSSRSSSLDKVFNEKSYLIVEQNSTRVLVIYVYADTNLLSKSNFEFFIRVGINRSKDADYYIILQQINGTYINEKNLPKLPSYAHYIQHENKCFDLGTIGWFLSNEMINKTNYKYFIFLNSSVRGPYLVSYYQSTQWYYAFTKRLNNYVKLVGPTISCQTSTHVQSYFWVTDYQGLLILLKDKDVFSCHKTQIDAIYHAEIPATIVLFNAGFSVDSLMKKYQGYDFRVNRHPDCYKMENPTSDDKVDGITLDPFELIFVKFKFTDRDYKHTASRLAAYDKWIQ